MNYVVGMFHKNSQNVFQDSFTIFIPKSTVWEFQVNHLQEHLDVIALNFSLSSGCIRYLTMVLTWISLLITIMNIFSCAYSSAAYITCYTIYSKLLFTWTIGLFVSLLSWVLYILDTISLSDICLKKLSSPNYSLCFDCLLKRKSLILMKFNIIIQSSSF